MSTNDGGPAFPSEYRTQDSDGHPCVARSEGMSLRDWFAGQAMCLLIQPFTNTPREEHADAKLVSEYAYEIADAMLAARGEQK